MQLSLIHKKPETEDCMSFFFQPNENIIWQAGQYLRYMIPNPQADTRGVQRYFSIAAAPSENIIMITTRIANENGSSFKSDLQKIKIGDIIEATGPFGTFTIEDVFTSGGSKLCFIAGGIGITPFRAILRDLDDNKKPINIILLYANRNQDIVFKNELDQIAAKNLPFKIHYLIEPNRIDAQTIQSLISSPQSPIYYISGPKPMVEGVEQMLANLQVPKEQIKTDSFPGYEWI